VTLRVATFNVQSGRTAQGGFDPTALVRSIRALNADLVALQEIDHHLERSGGRDQVAEIVAGLSAEAGEPWSGHFLPTVLGSPNVVRTWEPARDPQVPAGQPAYGIGVVTRLPVHAWHSLRLGAFWGRLPMLVPTARGRLVPLVVPDEPRAALAAVVESDLGVVTAIGTHLSFLPPRAVRQLKHIVAWSLTLPGPRFLLGDLNLPGGVPQRLTGWRRLADEPTFPADQPRRQLDHVLAEGLDPTHAVRATAVRGEVSDHQAVVVELSRR
jgi:endonuclease/exonuclease/phosphatase family metal-dependent hydrolase